MFQVFQIKTMWWFLLIFEGVVYMFLFFGNIGVFSLRTMVIIKNDECMIEICQDKKQASSMGFTAHLPLPVTKIFQETPPIQHKIRIVEFSTDASNIYSWKNYYEFREFNFTFFIRTTGSGTITTTIVKNRNHSLQKKSFLQVLI